MKTKIYITKKTTKTIQPNIGTDYLEIEIDSNLNLKNWEIENRRKLILTKDSLLNRENLNKEEQKKRLSILKESLENGTPISKDFNIPIGIYKNDEKLEKPYLDKYLERTKKYLSESEIETQKEIIEKIENEIKTQRTKKKK